MPFGGTQRTTDPRAALTANRAHHVRGIINRISGERGGGTAKEKLIWQPGWNGIAADAAITDMLEKAGRLVFCPCDVLLLWMRIDGSILSRIADYLFFRTLPCGPVLTPTTLDFLSR